MKPKMNLPTQPYLSWFISQDSVASNKVCHMVKTKIDSFENITSTSYLKVKEQFDVNLWISLRENESYNPQWLNNQK